jgi:hypothetical protein
VGWKEGWFEGRRQERCLIDKLPSAAELRQFGGAFYSKISICLIYLLIRRRVHSSLGISFYILCNLVPYVLYCQSHVWPVADLLRGWINSCASLSPELIAPFMYPFHSYAVSVPTKCKLPQGGSKTSAYLFSRFGPIAALGAP